MGVYGDQLAAFPELMEDHTVFKMSARIGGGYGGRYDIRAIAGYWSWRKSGKMGIEGDLRTQNHQAVLWAQDDALSGRPLISQNDYVEKDGDVYLVIEDDEFTREGGFTKCLMQKVAGPGDRQMTNTKVDEAIRKDYE
jgi:hypothetical protein